MTMAAADGALDRRQEDRDPQLRPVRAYQLAVVQEHVDRVDAAVGKLDEKLDATNANVADFKLAMATHTTEIKTTITNYAKVGGVALPILTAICAWVMLRLVSPPPPTPPAPAAATVSATPPTPHAGTVARKGP